MNELITALQIFAKYSDSSYPTHCEHDVLMITDISEQQMATADVEAVQKLGFFWSEEYDSWVSYKFGSA